MVDHLSGRDNNFNLIRVCAASAVLVSHASPITRGETAIEPIFALTGMSLGAHAVTAFFILSGLFIARSFDRSTSKIRFVVARVLRLFPALLVLLVVSVLAGASVTTLDAADYFRDAATLTYIPRNLSLAFLQYQLPGVFAGNPIGPTINGSLWTLFYEVACYAGLFLLGVAGILRMRWGFAALFALILVGFVASVQWEPQGGIAYRLDKLVQLGFPFVFGTLCYVWRNELVLDFRIAVCLWLLPFFAVGGVLMPLSIVVALGYSLLWIGLVPKGAWLAYNRLGDYSYGIYIYAFPVQQLMAHVFPGMTPLANIAAAAPVTIFLAFLSSHLIEEPALAQVRPLTDRIETWMARRTSVTSRTTQ